MSETGAITGSVVELHMLGQLIGATVSADMEEQTQLIRVDVIGRKHSREILEDGITCRFSAEAVYMDEEDWRRFRVVGNGERRSVQLPGVTAVLLDIEHAKVVCRMEGLKCSMKRVTVNKGRAVMTSVTFEGTIMTMGDDEAAA